MVSQKNPPAGETPGALEGLRVIDQTQVMAGPFCSMLLGDMGEVGTRGPEFHTEVGAYATERGIEQFWCAGALCAHAAQAFGATAQHFVDAPAMVAAIGELPAVASMLIKGSRFMQMERVVTALQEQKNN